MITRYLYGAFGIAVTLLFLYLVYVSPLFPILVALIVIIIVYKILKKIYSLEKERHQKERRNNER